MKRRLAAAAAASMLLTGGRASAAVLEYDWSGTVSAGSDVAGVFGPAGADLGGDSYTARFIFDDDRGVQVLDYGVDYILYNPSFNVNSPALSATLTINDISVTVNTSGSGNANNDPTNRYEFNETEGAGTVTAPDYSIIDESLFNVTYSPPTLEADFSTFGTTNESDNYFQIAEDEPSNPDTPQVSGLLLPTTVTERVLSAAPEPSTWAFMMAGLFGIGAVLRRRQACPGWVAARELTSVAGRCSASG